MGAGPGDPGLLTIKGQACLQQADVVLYDGLVNPLLLQHLSAAAIRTCRVEGPAGRRLDQQEINNRLIAEARAGRNVVRLKGGDPYIFGRGSEEAAALAAAGIPFEVVPGITAATGAAIYAGISLTHRDCASAVAFVTGHEDPQKPASMLDYAALARFPGTLVFYMGLHRLPLITAELIRQGLAPTTPAAVVCRGTLPSQRVVAGTVETIPAQAAAARLHAPSLLIIGAGVAHREVLNWYEAKPLFGLRIGITRPEGQADAAIAEVLQRGGEPVLLPTMRITPVPDWSAVDTTLGRLAEFDWLIFTSVNGVQYFFDRLWELGGDPRRLGGLQLACIGAATAARLEEYRLRADLVPREFRAEGLAAELSPRVQGKRVLWVRANRGRDVLPEVLSAAGASLEQLVVYHHQDLPVLDPQVLQQLAAGELEWICLSSPAIARNLAAQLSPAAREQLGRSTLLAVISPVTQAAAEECGLPVAVVAREYTWSGMLSAIEELRRQSPVSS